MLRVISRDFDVELVSQSNGMALFAAERDDHFHFVIDDQAALCIRQFHIPHFCLAIAVAISPRVKPNMCMGFLTNTHPFYLTKFATGGLGFTYANESFHINKGPAGEKLLAAMGKAATQLESAEKQVQECNGNFSLPKAETRQGQPIESKRDGLIKAISFEKVKYGKLDAKRFGIFSAFSRLMDSVGTRITTTALRSLVVEQLAYPVEDLNPDNKLLKMAINVQDTLFPRLIWGPGIEISVENAMETVVAGLNKLSDAQRTQFALLRGKHRSGLLLPLAAITKCIGFNRYAEILTSGSQPDSKTEQGIRTTSTYVELFSELVGDQDSFLWQA